MPTRLRNAVLMYLLFVAWGVFLCDFVSIEETDKVLGACPDGQWRTLIALARFGRLRIPSEALALTWDDINWADGKVTITSPKTAHHEGHGSRVIPLFPELRRYLQEAYDLAGEGEKFVITRYRAATKNLRTQLLKIIGRAGLTPWEKPWQNMRSTRETELAESCPMHVVCAWIGNSQPVALRHYIQVTDSHFAAANTTETRLVLNPTLRDAPMEPHRPHEEFETSGFTTPRPNETAQVLPEVGVTGFEPVTSTV